MDFHGAGSRYSSGALSHDIPTELDRLRALEQLWDRFTHACFAEIGLRRNWRCLEIGAGAGSIARWLARQCPDGTVVATDLDTRFLHGSGNLTVRRHDVSKEDFPAMSFDLIHARHVLCHVEDREEVLARAANWLVPGGVLLVEEPDFSPIDTSPHPRLRRAVTRMEAALAASQGSDFRWARCLPAALPRAGYTLGGLRAFPILIGGNSGADPFFRVTFLQLRAALAGDPSLTADIDAVLAMMREPTFADVVLLTMAAWGRRP